MSFGVLIICHTLSYKPTKFDLHFILCIELGSSAVIIAHDFSFALVLSDMNMEKDYNMK
jgi:hypothetical protein